VNYAGVLLILFAIVLFIAEIKVISHGLLTVGGIVSLVMGSLLLFDSSEPALRVSLQVLVPTVTMVSLFFIGVISLVVKSQLSKKHTGKEGMEGAEGVTVTEIFEQGKVLIKGEYWNAVSERKIERGKHIRVKSVEGLNLNVEAID
jgi:membrane-bound serine protease (ClpP class)